MATKILALNPISSDRRYEPGEYLDLPDADALELVKIGAAQIVTEGAPGQPVSEDPSDPPLSPGLDGQSTATALDPANSVQIETVLLEPDFIAGGVQEIGGQAEGELIGGSENHADNSPPPAETKKTKRKQGGAES